MVTAERRQKQISFHNVDLYNSIQIPVREYLLELTNDLELSVLLNQMIFSKKEYMTLNDIKRLSLNEKTKQTIRVKLEQLIEMGFVKKLKENKIIYNQDLYKVVYEVISPKENDKILGIIEGKDLNYDFHYLIAMLINKFRTYALSGINELTISVCQLKIMLGINNSESSIRNALNQLIEDNYITDVTNINNTNKYILNVDKLINNYSLEDINKYTDELEQLYEEYLKRMAYHIYKNKLGSSNYNIDSYTDMTLKKFKNIVKKMFESGKADYYVLKHIIIYLVNNENSERYIEPKIIKEDYTKLSTLSKELSKRKAKRLLYKFKNNLLNNESYKALNKVYWEEAYKFINIYKNFLRKKHFDSNTGVNYIDYDDYYQEAINITYQLLKKYNITDFEDSEKYDKNILLREILYRLQDYMYQKRDNIKNNQQQDLEKKDYQIYTVFINNEETYIKTINNYTTDPLCSNFLIKDEEPKQTDIEYSEQALNNIFSILDERNIYIIKHYIGFNGKNLTFKEIGEQLGLSESLIARKYKQAIQQLREHFPPDKEQELRQLIFNT